MFVLPTMVAPVLEQLEVQEVPAMMQDALKLLEILGELLPPDAPAFHLITNVGGRCAVRLASGGKLWTCILSDDDMLCAPGELARRIVNEHKGQALVAKLAADHRATTPKPVGPHVQWICECGCIDGKHRELKVGLACIVILAIIMFVAALWTFIGGPAQTS